MDDFVNGVDQCREALGFRDNDVNTGGGCQPLSDVVPEHSEKDDFGLEKSFLQNGCDLDAIQFRHDHVENDEIRTQKHREVYGLTTVVRFPANRELGAPLKVDTNSGSNNFVVVSDEDPDRRGRMHMARFWRRGVHHPAGRSSAE